MNNPPYPNYEVKKNLKPKALTGLSDKMIEQHWSLYEGYVNNVNLLSKSLWETLQESKPLQTPPYSEIERRLGFEFNGMVLHEYYFGQLTAGVPEPAKSSKLVKRLSKDFGSFENWKRQIGEIGRMRGVGWALTVMDPLSKRLLNIWVGDHELGHVAGFLPIVAMDVWEHAYLLDYGVKPEGKAAYLEAFFKNLNWELIEERAAAADQAKVWSRDAMMAAV